jgi:hypothetical protein
MTRVTGWEDGFTGNVTFGSAAGAALGVKLRRRWPLTGALREKPEF